MTPTKNYWDFFKQNGKIIGSLCSLTVSFTFCLHFFIAKDVLKTVPPIVLGGVRGVLGGLLLYVIYVADLKRDFTRHNLFLLLSIAFFGYFITQILFLNGLKLSSPLNTSVIMNTIPIVAALLAMLFRVETFAWRKLIGGFLGFSMILWLSLSTGDKHFTAARLGDLLIFLSVVTLCIGTILTKHLVKTGFPSTIISASMLFFGGLGLSALELNNLHIVLDYALLSDINLGKIIFEIVISTALTYLLSFKALKYLAPSQSMIFIYLQPAMTAAIDYMFLAKVPPFVLVPVFLGVILSSYLVMSADSR